MSSSTHDQTALKHIRRRLHYSSLAYAVPAVVVWWLTSTWLERRFGLSRQVAQSAMSLSFFVVTVLLAPLLRFRKDVSLRHRSLFNDWMNQRFTQLRPLFIVYIIYSLFKTLWTMHYRHHGLIFDNPNNLVSVMLISLAPWYMNLSFSRPDEPIDELVVLEHFRAAVRGFATLVVLGLAAFIGNDALPGTLHITFPAALLASALVAHLSLWAQDRRARRSTDDE